VLSVAGHLTDRDRELVRLVARHRVLTTDQLAALAFGNITTARHRLAVVVRLGLLRRFRPHLQTGSAPWHYVLGPIGAALLGQEDRDEKRWLLTEDEVCPRRADVPPGGRPMLAAALSARRTMINGSALCAALAVTERGRPCWPDCGQADPCRV
jgi:hypothetical protein